MASQPKALLPGDLVIGDAVPAFFTRHLGMDAETWLPIA
jgi:hypothetical protein